MGNQEKKITTDIYEFIGNPANEFAPFVTIPFNTVDTLNDVVKSLTSENEQLKKANRELVHKIFM